MNEPLRMLAFAGLGMQELLVILLIAVLIFGAAKIPDIARSLGKALREFKKAGKEVQDQIDEVSQDENDKKPPAQS